MIAFLTLAALASAIPADLPFEKWFTAHGVQVEIARKPGSPPWLRSTAELPVSADKVTSTLTDFKHYKDFFAPAIKKADVLDSEGGATRIHFVWPYPFPLRNRDAVVSYRVDHLCISRGARRKVSRLGGRQGVAGRAGAVHKSDPPATPSAGSTQVRPGR